MGRKASQKKKKNPVYGRIAEELSKVRLGRYPFAGGIKYYEEKKSIRYTKTTIVEDTRKLRYFARIFEGFKARGKIKTTDPRHLGPEAIEELYRWMKGGDLGNSTQGTYVRILKRYLEMWGNNIIGQMEQDDEIIIQSAAGDSEVNAMSIEEVRRVYEVMERVGGYRGVLIRLLIDLGISTGCRPKELFNAEVEDINVDAETFFVRHPKGEGSWGKREKVNLIRQDLLLRIRRELQARAKYLEELGIESKYVFVNPETRIPYVGNSFRRWKKDIETMAGVKFMLKDLRSTLLNLLVGDDLSMIGPASKQLRHERIDNTEKYYLKINKRQVVRNALGDRWKDGPIE